MRLWLPLLLILSFCAVTSAQAGPWLRKKGSGFSSFSITLNKSKDFSTSTYLEYGLNDKMTIGADVASFTLAEGDKSGFGTLFIRRALGANTGNSRWAYELGVGTAWVGDLMLPHVKTGLTWGRGFQFRQKNGWMTVDASVKWGISHSENSSKVDATLGLNFTDRTSGMIQLYLSHLDDAFYATLAPSVVFTARKSKFRIQLGTELPLDDMQNASLKLGLWREF